ncbi:hypothetical protein [Paenibacillus dokdonensis]|uniref:hypothetical protein n=1 Tax=Paenibacillus dokdonensis TaxID=2567944 RepID=UPI003D2A32E1
MASCNTPVSSTTSYIQVISKETGKKDTHTITVKNPYDNNAKPFFITVTDEKLWNLMELNRIYFSSYEYKKITDRVDLLSIQYPNEPADKPDAPENKNSITVSMPMTIAKSDLYPDFQIREYLSVQLVKGSYSEDWNPSPLMGRVWTGDFEFVLSDEYGKVIQRKPLNDFYQEKLIFNSFFDIEFGDYNGDGEIDFTIGQYGSSNGNVYKIFTLSKDGQIRELKIKGQNELVISGGDSRYSTKLIKISSQSFQKKYYDNAKGKTFEDTYKWDGQEFMKTTSK